VATNRNGARQRLLRYAYSNKNLAGCAGALVGLGLYPTAGPSGTG
jgi:hypothetical protein